MLMVENYFKVCLYSGVMTAPVNDGTLDIMKALRCVWTRTGAGKWEKPHVHTNQLKKKNTNK